MPGEDALYPEMEAVDRYPKTEDEHAKILGWVTDSFNAADRVREPHRERWERYYRLYRGYITRNAGDWRSKVFWPIVFFIVETITPRLVAQLPKMIVQPVDEDDVEGAKLMQQLLGWASERSKLYLSLVEMYRSALKYGTGICKVYHAHEVARRRVRVPVMAPAPPTIANTPLMDPDTGGPMMDLDGQEMVEEVEEPQLDEMGQPAMIDTGETEVQWQEKVLYDGPKAEWVSLLNFWVAPEATSIEDASYVIQRYFRDTAYVKEKIEEGLYQLPAHKSVISLESGTKDPLTSQAQSAGIGADDTTRSKTEVWEMWTNDTVVTVLNREVVVRVADNPFDHGMKPYIRVCDHYVEGEFYGIGEIEPLEGLQDQINALVNQRIDNVRLVLDRMFAFDPENIYDLRDLAVRPGGAIRVKGKDIPARDVIQPIETHDVTSSSYQETAEAERMTEKISGVNAYTAGGQDAASMNSTATGVSLISEAGNTRFALKVRMGEITGLSTLAYMYGSIWQQFADDEIVVRITGDDGKMTWDTIAGDAIQGGYDFTILAESSTVTESVQKEQAMSLFQVALSAVRPQDGSPIFNLDKMGTELIEAFNKRDVANYIAPAPPPPMIDPNTGQPMIDPATGMPIPPPTPEEEEQMMAAGPPMQVVQ